MKEQLIEYMKTHKNVSIYTNQNNTDTFINGYVIGVDDHDFLISSYTPNGAYDGYIMRPIEDVFQIQVDTKYNIAMTQLIEDTVSCEDFCAPEEELLISVFLRWIKRKGLVLSVRLYQSESLDISGYIEEVNEQTCVIRLLDLYGQEDGKTVIDLDCITEVYCDTDTEQRIQKLNEINA